MKLRWIHLLLALLVSTSSLAAETFLVIDHSATFDRWFYDQNQSPGIRPEGSVFAGPLQGTEDADRLGMIVIGFDTTSLVPAGLGTEAYSVSPMNLTLTVSRDQEFIYDGTFDGLESYGPDGIDTDAGRPIELHGVGLNNYEAFGFDSPSSDAVYGESGPYSTDETVNVFASDNIGGNLRDITNNFRDGFESVPWAVGQAELANGAAVPKGTPFEFSIDVSHPDIESYLKQGLNEGGLFFGASSLATTSQQSTNGIPNFWLRESDGHFLFNGVAPLLDLEVQTGSPLTGDFDGNALYDCSDLDALTLAIVQSSTGSQFDLNGDSLIDTADLNAWLSTAGNASSGGEPFQTGDANLDGIVDSADFGIWNANRFTATTGWCSGDFDADGFADISDFNLWNQHRANATQSVAVPEPGSLPFAMTAFALLASFFRYRPKQRCRDTIDSNRRSGFTLVELLVVIAIIGILVSLLIPAVQVAREAARKLHCSNNLRQLGLAVQNYESANHHLPPPKLGTQFENRGSTLVALLPYLEESAAFREYNLEASVDAPENLRITGARIGTYLCPSMSLPRETPHSTCGERLAPGSYVISSRTTYAKHNELDGAFENPKPGRSYRLGFRHIKDGTTKTIVFGEVDYGHETFIWSDCSKVDGQPKWGDTTWANGYWFFAWGHMSADFPQLYNNNDDFFSPYSPRAFRSDHPSGVQFAHLDGSVSFLPGDADPTVRSALVTRAGQD